MLANTKQVRAVLKSFNISANYTEKTTVNATTTRVVMADMFAMDSIKFNALLNAVQQKFTELGYTNKVYSTQQHYLRIKTFLA